MKFFTNMVEKVKENSIKKYITEVHCSCCGAKGKLILFKELSDHSLLCPACAKKAPYEIADRYLEGTLDEYKKAVAYSNMSEKVYKPIFKDDAGYGLFEVDSKRLLFRLWSSEGSYIIPLKNIQYYEFHYTPHVEDRLLRDMVQGDVRVTLHTTEPDVQYNSYVIMHDQEAPCSKQFLSNTYVYDDPPVLREFKVRLDALIKASHAPECYMR